MRVAHRMNPPASATSCSVTTASKKMNIEGSSNPRLWAVDGRRSTLTSTKQLSNAPVKHRIYERPSIVPYQVMTPVSRPRLHPFHLIISSPRSHLAGLALTAFVLPVPNPLAALAFAATACIFSTLAALALAFLTLAFLAADMSFPFAIAMHEASARNALYSAGRGR